jgi:hypothetical protein
MHTRAAERGRPKADPPSLTDRAALVVATTLAFSPPLISAQADPRVERLKTEALQMVEARAEMVQEIVDMLFSFGELGMQEFETQRYLTGILANHAPGLGELPCHAGRLGAQSLRSALTGSMPIARRVGAMHATPATRSSTAGPARSVAGSSRLVSNRSDEMAWLPKTAIASPAATPSTAGSIPTGTTREKMLPDVAPRAMRIPISDVRRDTE